MVFKIILVLCYTYFLSFTSSTCWEQTTVTEVTKPILANTVFGRWIRTTIATQIALHCGNYWSEWVIEKSLFQVFKTIIIAMHEILYACSITTGAISTFVGIVFVINLLWTCVMLHNEVAVPGIISGQLIIQVTMMVITSDDWRYTPKRLRWRNKLRRWKADCGLTAVYGIHVLKDMSWRLRQKTQPPQREWNPMRNLVAQLATRWDELAERISTRYSTNDTTAQDKA